MRNFKHTFGEVDSPVISITLATAATYARVTPQTLKNIFTTIFADINITTVVMAITA